MARLGYERYGAHGNDSGSMISPEIGRHDPEHVVGVHVTQLFSFPSGDPAEFADLSEEDELGDIDEDEAGILDLDSPAVRATLVERSDPLFGDGAVRAPDDGGSTAARWRR